MSVKEKRQGWKLLFDGSTTNGWHNYLKNSITGWEAHEGTLTSNGKNGDIVTDDLYDNFELVIEWKIAEKGNGGIFFNIQEDQKYPRMYETGPEFQIIDDENYPAQLTENQKTGSASDVKAQTILASKRVGEWNKARIIVNKGKVEHWLNNKKVVEYNLDSVEWKELISKSKFANLPYSKVHQGKIGLQDHGSFVAFKNIKLRSL